MAKFNFKPAVDADGDVIEGSQEANFQAKVVSFIKDADGNPKTYQSQSTDKEYHIATIEFENAEGKMLRRNARVYTANYAHGMTEGETYSATVRVTQGYNPFITVSHLQSAGFDVTNEMFGLPSTEAVEAEYELEREA